MKALELIIERIILSSRWILVVFYIGLVAALAVYAVSFGYKFLKIASGVFELDEAEMILAMLGLIDAALVASLIVMVMISRATRISSAASTRPARPTTRSPSSASSIQAA
ncbi:uncharacterized protein (TIGR00645 family) [Rhizobium leguminosarum]|nr:uncharacterized protein (TIGR00645 family) [Rhizobium leguminosarum]